MRRLAAGDLGALGELYDRHWEDVHRFVVYATQDATDAEDLAQNVFLTAARVAERYDGRASCRPWLIGIAVRLVERKWQRQGRVARYLARWASSLNRVPESETCSRGPEHARSGGRCARADDAHQARRHPDGRGRGAHVRRDRARARDPARHRMDSAVRRAEGAACSGTGVEGAVSATGRCHRLFEAQAVRDGRLTGPALDAHQVHVRGCAQCRAEARILDELSTSLRALPFRRVDELTGRRRRAQLLARVNEAQNLARLWTEHRVASCCDCRDRDRGRRGRSHPAS